jgi:hypothetical protein
MRALALVVLLCAHLARAADDAPLEPVLVPGAQRIAEGKAMAACLAENQSLKTGNVVVSVPAFIAIVVGVAAASVAVTVGVAAVTGPKR